MKLVALLPLLLAFQLECCQAFLLVQPAAVRVTTPAASSSTRASSPLLLSSIDNDSSSNDSSSAGSSRRQALGKLVTTATTATAGLVVTTTLLPPQAALAAAEDDASTSMYSPKFVQTYDDFQETPEGWSFRDVTAGTKGGIAAAKGDRVVFDWNGFTLGYFGRPFQAKGGPKGGAFDKDVDFLRTVLGSGAMVPGLECALQGMQPGGVRQVIVPYGPLSYPNNKDGDASHDKVGPKPTTFSGQRALNFVLENPRVDRTLLFNVKVIRVDKPNGKGGFVRG